MEQLKQNNGFDISDDALDALSKHYSSGMATEVETSETIKCMLTSSGQLLCPHTAIGVKVAKELRDNEVPMVTLATAHPAKFPAAVKKASLAGLSFLTNSSNPWAGRASANSIVLSTSKDSTGMV